MSWIFTGGKHSKKKTSQHIEVACFSKEFSPIHNWKAANKELGSQTYAAGRAMFVLPVHKTKALKVS